MNFRTTGIIISREYLNKVRKKSFLITTFLVPVLFAALCIVPSIIMVASKEDAKKVAVIDDSGIVMPTLSDSETVCFSDFYGRDLDSVKTALESLGIDAVLYVSAIEAENKTVQADIFSVKPLGVTLSENLNNRINKAVESYRVDSYGIEGLADIMKDVKADIKLHSYTIDEEGKENISESEVYMIVSLILGMIIYMFITLFGASVMSSVIEEKSSRVVEILISSVKTTELMFGKIIGMALVALTQFFLWIVLTSVIVGVVGAVSGNSLLGGQNPAEMLQTVGGVDAGQAEAIAGAVSEPGELSMIISTLSNLNFGQILFCFVVFFVFGYMLYASFFAAIGSASENEADSQQLQIPLTIPLLIAFFIAFYAFKAPDSAVVFWGSMIPFTSPIVMLARLPFGVPVWEIALSLVLLVATFALCAWISAKIYRVGILMFGKKSTWKDLWKWFRQK